MLARAALPKAVNCVGDRIIGLDYEINKKAATKNYIEQSKDATRLSFEQLKNSNYSLSEVKTKKQEANKSVIKSKLFHSVRNPLKLNAKLRKSLYKLETDDIKQLRYSTFEKVNLLWQQYAKSNTIRDASSVFKLDLHGCQLTCTASRNPTLIGSEGIVVQETKNTFLVITKTNRLLTLPKRESIFEFKINNSASGGGGGGGEGGNVVYEIHGSNLLFTAQTRTKVKYKQLKCQTEI